MEHPNSNLRSRRSNLATRNLLKPGKGIWINNASIYSDKHFCNYLLSKWQLWQTLYPTIYQNKVTW